MDAADLDKRTGLTNELAKERNRAAAERTLAAWIRKCITLIGFGLAIDQTSQALSLQSSPHTPGILDGLTSMIALAFIAFGIFLLGIALMQYRLEVKSIEQEDYVLLSVTQLNQFVVGAMLVFGVISSLAICLGYLEVKASILP
ncbi:MAG: DUF202 domain-containing protein [Cyanobacteria bacterium P01_F01_bin.86]